MHEFTKNAFVKIHRHVADAGGNRRRGVPAHLGSGTNGTGPGVFRFPSLPYRAIDFLAQPRKRSNGGDSTDRQQAISPLLNNRRANDVRNASRASV